MILVIGSVIAKAGALPDALALSREHVARSRGEPGCVSHAVHQDADNPQRLVFIEQWADPASLQQHFAVPASRHFAKALAALAAEPPALAIYRAEPVKLGA